MYNTLLVVVRNSSDIAIVNDIVGCEPFDTQPTPGSENLLDLQYNCPYLSESIRHSLNANNRVVSFQFDEKLHASEALDLVVELAKQSIDDESENPLIEEEVIRQNQAIEIFKQLRSKYGIDLG